MRNSLKNSLWNKNEIKTLSYSLAFSAFLLLSHVVSAQNRISATLRPGINFPTNDLGNANIKTGYGIEGTVAYRFMPHLSIYAGWGWNHFAADKSFAGQDMDFEETGYRLGLHFIHPIESSTLSYLLGAGVIYNHI
jgi:opacity protein-like surface antigen